MKGEDVHCVWAVVFMCLGGSEKRHRLRIYRRIQSTAYSNEPVHKVTATLAQEDLLTTAAAAAVAAAAEISFSKATGPTGGLGWPDMGWDMA